MQKELRLQSRNDFQRVYRHGKSSANHQFVVYHMPNDEADAFRVGLSVSKKVGGAVVRNRIRRMLKEILRHMEHSITPGTYFVVIVRKPALELDYEGMRKSLIHVLKRAGLYQAPSAKPRI
ncbi:ribonuclease P protein component [Paenibacillus turpanensis]|uniref:ribonuclease P protein component n=1 Tax=Paenibacillus turpanensis TaxID=2689078 RepID=UPI0014080198|nr:ribonuclease P protein component [Paenibacillus turpanensis]